MRRLAQGHHGALVTQEHANAATCRQKLRVRIHLTAIELETERQIARGAQVRR